MINKIFTITALLISSLTMGQSLTLNNMESKLKWTGKEMTTKEHYGSIDFKSGIMTLKDNQPVYGKFIVDMITLKNEDLPEDYRGRLEGHLKSDDFFSVDKFSEAILEFTTSSVQNSVEYNIQANLTIKGTTHPVDFTMNFIDDHWKANLIFDRSKYDVRFRSGTFFENLGDKLIYDDIVIETDLFFKM